MTPQTLQQIACWLRVDVPGQYSVMASTRGVTADKWQLVIGENTIVWRTSNASNFASTNNVNFTSDLRFPDPGAQALGWYSRPKPWAPKHLATAAGKESTGGVAMRNGTPLHWRCQCADWKAATTLYA